MSINIYSMDEKMNMNVSWDEFTYTRELISDCFERNTTPNLTHFFSQSGEVGEITSLTCEELLNGIEHIQIRTDSGGEYLPFNKFRTILRYCVDTRQGLYWC